MAKQPLITLLCLLAWPVFGADSLVQQLDSATDQQRNLLRLALVLDRLGTGNAELAEVIQLISNTSNPRDAQLALRSLLPAIARGQGRKQKRISAPKTQNAKLRVTSSTTKLQWGQVYATPIQDPKQNPILNKEPASIGVWLQAFNDSAEQDDREGVEGFDSESRGWAVGIDRSLGETFFVGSSLAFVVGDVDSARFGDDDNKSIEYNLYASGGFGNSQSLTASVTYSQNETNRRRFVVIRTDTETRIIRLTSDIDSNQWRAALTWSGSLGDPLGFSAAPYLTFSHSILQTDDYAENGGDAVRLLVSNEDEKQTSGSAGISLSYLFDAGSWLILPSVNMSYEHDFAADSAQTFSRFNNTPLAFDTQGYSPANNRWRGGAGLQFLHLDGIGISLGVDIESQDDYEYIAAIISLQYDL